MTLTKDDFLLDIEKYKKRLADLRKKESCLLAGDRKAFSRLRRKRNRIRAEIKHVAGLLEMAKEALQRE